MADMKLTDLYNPHGYVAILTTKNQFIEAGENQAWQEYPRSMELWQKMDNGLLMRVKRWLDKSIVMCYAKEDLIEED